MLSRLLPKLIFFTFVVAVATVVVGSGINRGRRPILLHVFSDLNCACGDIHEKVSGLAIWNPLRDRSHERSAESFLINLRANKCFGSRELCDDALPRNRVSGWRLMYRENVNDSVSLYFKLTKNGVSDPRYYLTGEGAIDLQRNASGWIVTSYSAYF